jgi:hypothetical protein
MASGSVGKELAVSGERRSAKQEEGNEDESRASIAKRHAGSRDKSCVIEAST